MALAYRPPGVNVDETVSPQISPLLAAPALVCLVGPSQGYQVRTDQFVLTGTSPIRLPGLPADAVLFDEDAGTGGIQATVTVRDTLNPAKGASDGSGYTVTTDYTIRGAAGTISRVGAGGIADNTLVTVTYKYVPTNYFEPIRLFDLGSVESRFGSGLNATATAINSPVSYAASIAFENGADSVVIQPLFARATPGDPTSTPGQPSATNMAATTTWADTLYVLRDIEDINVIVPVIGQSVPNVGDSVMLNIMQSVQDHCYFMSQQDQYIIGVFGEDASASNTVAQKATIQSHASTLRSRYGGGMAEQTVLLSPAKFQRSLPSFNANIALGGQYAAAGYAGMLASRPVSVSLTRKVMSGFQRVLDSRDANEKNADAAAGLCVLEDRRGVVQVRHSITTDISQSARREVSVVRAKHRMIESVRDTLDLQVIANIIADGNANSIIENTVIGVLERLRQDRDLVDYAGVTSRILSLEPTLAQVRFSYRPAFPLNYIDVIFAMDLSAGTITANPDNVATLTTT
jgi:hypothetical protein